MLLGPGLLAGCGESLIALRARLRGPAFSADSSLENLDDSRIACGFHASIRRKIRCSRRRETSATAC